MYMYNFNVKFEYNYYQQTEVVFLHPTFSFFTLQFFLQVEKCCDQPVELLWVSRLALLYDVDEVMREDERDSFPLNAKLGFEVAQDVAKVDVKKLKGRQVELMCGCDEMHGQKECRPTCPVLRTMMLSLWRSPMPRT